MRTKLFFTIIVVFTSLLAYGQTKKPSTAERFKAEYVNKNLENEIIAMLIFTIPTPMGRIFVKFLVAK